MASEVQKSAERSETTELAQKISADSKEQITGAADQMSYTVESSCPRPNSSRARFPSFKVGNM